VTKEVLFLEEIESLVFAYGGTHWDWYKVPIPMRKWYIRRYNKRQEEQQNQPGSDTSKPLTESERKKMIANAQQATNIAPKYPPNLMKTMRNRG
jgi:hypothetical protein